MNNIILSLYLLSLSVFIFLLYYIVLPNFKKLKFGQTVREVGPRSHQSKNGTPTMGGVLIFISFCLVVISMFVVFPNYLKLNYINLLILFIPLIGYLVLGLIDDILIIKTKKNNGIKPTIKLLIQLIIALIFYTLLVFTDFDTSIQIFNINIDLKYFYGLFIILVFTSTTNATNLTDGLDGLLSVTTIPLLIGYIIIGTIKQNHLVIILSSAMLISLIIFLFFNFPKAFLFMGDTGSLFIGAFLCVISIILKVELFLLIFGFVFIFETLSVIIQVIYFKKTKGKRLFKMAPFHHHLELSGYSNLKINFIFFLTSLISVIIGLIIFGVTR